MKSFKEFTTEENTQGDIGTDKLTRNRKKLTPGESLVTPEPYKDFILEPSRNSSRQI